jgi:GGDEF domain-containing protein
VVADETVIAAMQASLSESLFASGAGASFGTVVFQPPHDLATALKAADLLLYEAKRKRQHLRV